MHLSRADDSLEIGAKLLIHLARGASRRKMQPQQPQQAQHQNAEQADMRERQPPDDDHQQQQPQQGPPPTDQMAVEEGQGREAEKATPRSSSKNSNSSSEPGKRQMKRTMLNLRDDLEDVESEVSSLRLRMLWLMSQEVRRERQEASRQIILQGFDPRTEPGNYAEAVGLV